LFVIFAMVLLLCMLALEHVFGFGAVSLL